MLAPSRQSHSHSAAFVMSQRFVIVDYNEQNMKDADKAMRL